MKRVLTITVAIALVMLILTGLSGCRSTPGTNIQNSGVGIALKPMGDIPAGPKLMLGSFASSYSTPPGNDTGPNLNRVQIRAPLGVDHTGTIASGPIGEQLQKGDGTLVQSLKVLHPNNQTTLVPFEVPLVPQQGQTVPPAQVPSQPAQPQ